MENQEISPWTKNQRFKIKERWKKSGIRISKELRDIIHGYVMSDGYIRKGVLTVDQGQKQALFVQWMYQKLSDIRTSADIQDVIRIHSQTGTKSRSLRFFTKALLQGFWHMWYKRDLTQNGEIYYQKRLPKTLPCFFNATLITLWYAGDGTKTHGSAGAKFEVTAFTVEERLQLKALFLKKFNIDAQIIASGVSRKGKTQWALKISAKDYPKFRSLITQMDLIQTVFPYKLHKKTKI